jgi:hypothetical protein
MARQADSARNAASLSWHPTAFVHPVEKQSISFQEKCNAFAEKLSQVKHENKLHCT